MKVDLSLGQYRSNMYSSYNTYLQLGLMLCSLIRLGFAGNKFNFVVNPNCTLNCDKPWIIYGRSDQNNSIIHYLWSAVELPTFVIAVSTLDTEIQIDWQNLTAGIPGAISFSKVPENVFGVSFQTLILFNDVNDTGKIDNIPEKDKKYAFLSEFEWIIDKFDNKTSEDFLVSFYTTSFRGYPLVNDSKISISVITYGSEGRSNTLPHLLTLPSSVQLEIVLDNLILNLNESYFSDSSHHHARDDVIPISGFNYPRWALDTIFISDDTSNNEEPGFLYQNKKSLDDEYTPGVFDLDTITTAASRNSSSKTSGGYIQWRPVCYLTTDRDINYSTYPNLNTSLPPIDKKHIENTKSSLFYILFGKNFKNLLGFQTPIAFGQSKDEYYTKYNYTVWTFSMGVGAVPAESFSPVIITIISVGVGLPCLLFILGGTFLAVKKFRQRGELLLVED